MAEITSLSTILKTAVSIDDYFLVANKTTKKARKLSVKSMLPSITTKGAGSVDLYTGITGGNQIQLKGIKSYDTKLSVTTVDDNVLLTVNEANLDLSKMNNSTAGFLTKVNLSGVVTGSLSVPRGGTGLKQISKGGVLYANANNALAVTPLILDGALLIGSSSSGHP